MFNHPIAPRIAKRLISVIREDGRVVYSRPHALQRLAQHRMTIVDVVNVLRGGVVDPAEFENGQWRYRVRTNRFVVIVQFLSDDKLLVVTAWRLTT